MTMATPTLQQRLDEAVWAHHQLLTGSSVQTVVDQNGERITYYQGDAARLEVYIRDLIAKVTGIRPVSTIHFRTSKGL